MTRLARRNYGNNHGYQLDGVKVPGVTSVIGILDKPALQSWAARETAAFADDQWERLSGMRSADRLVEMERARYNTNKTATVKGNRIHALADKLARGLEVDVPDSLRSEVTAAARFLDKWDFETLVTEAPCAHTGYRFAGTLDSIVFSDRFGTAMVDWKTGKGVYAETALQVAAYGNCDLLQVVDSWTVSRGKAKPVYREEPMPAIDTYLVAHVLSDDVELLPVDVGPRIEGGPGAWETFLYLLAAGDWHGPATDRKRDDYAPPIGEAVFPEDTIEREDRTDV